MLLLAYASNREGGLLNCFVGEAKLDLSGSVSWEWIEPLAITDAEGGTGGISVVSPIDPSAPGFGTGAEPSINLEDADDTANESNEH